MESMILSREAPSAFFGPFASRAPKMIEALAALARQAEGSGALIVEGETGVGKELAAETVHRQSARRNAPFVVFDCAEKSPEVADFELFGSEQDPGVLERAQGGSVLLDHIDELPRSLQAKLLRAFEHGEVRSSTHHAKLDVRVMAACSTALQRAVRRHTFSRNLYGQLGSERVRIPALRERTEDIPLLAAAYLGALAPARTLADIPERVWLAFHAHRWPGNVRELHNALQRALIVPDRALGFPRSA
jgi:DNA-binding NtrC family response regulator